LLLTIEAEFITWGLPPSFVADHPFYYFIRDNATKLVLFSGRLAQPPSS
jgi:serine protease inhibitor